MHHTLKRLIKLTVGYSPITLLGPLSLIFLTPLYTRVLTPADYGVVDIALTLAALLAVVVSLGLDQALNSFFFDGDADHQRNIVTTVAVYLAVIGALVAVVVALLALPLSEALFGTPDYQQIIYLVAISVLAAPIYGMTAAVMRLQMRVRDVNILGIVNLSVLILANVLLVLILRLGATGTVLANTVTVVISCLLGLALLRTTLRGRVGMAILKPIWLIGLSLVIGILGNSLLVSSDRLLMTQFVSTADIGLYSIANKLAMMLSVLVTGAWMAWMPLSLSIASDADAPRQYARVYELFICVTLVGALALGLFAPEILAVFTTTSYVPAAPYAAVLMFYTGPITSSANTFAIGLFTRKRTYLLSVAVIVGAAVNIVLNLWWLPMLGVWGAVISTVVAGSIWAGLAYLFSRQALRVPYRWKQIGALVIVYTVLIVTFLFRSELFAWPVKLGAIAMMAISIPLVGIISKEQMHEGWVAVNFRVRSQFNRVS
ncbi:MAG: polysaccharide biosynthesis protein [Caldilineaceae bacterium]|nr:polysaccharide biosynthesis protein [Caldilineaceae bacterium]